LKTPEAPQKTELKSFKLHLQKMTTPITYCCVRIREWNYVILTVSQYTARQQIINYILLFSGVALH